MARKSGDRLARDLQPPAARERAVPDKEGERKLSSIVTYVHHYKRPPKKKPPAPAIDQAVVTAKRTDAKSKAAETANKSAIVTSISQKEAEFLRHARGAEHDVEARDEDTDAALTARYRALMARELRPEKKSAEERQASGKPPRKSSIVTRKQRADALDITPEELERRVDAADALFRDVVRRTKARAKQQRSSSGAAGKKK